MSAGAAVEVKAGSVGGPHQAEGPVEFLGPRIRELRKAQRLTLQGLAELTGLSVGYLSQIERNIATPSIKALHDVARALGVNVSWFFPDPGEASGSEARYIVRAERRRALRFAFGVRDELLCPSLSGQLELLCCHFEPGATAGEAAYSHPGEEAGVIVAGALEMWIDGERFDLRQGDSFNFPSTKPHWYRNPGPAATTVVWAITPPSY